MSQNSQSLQQQQLQQQNILNAYSGQQFSQQGLLAGAQLQAPANNQNFSKILLENQQASFQPPNQVIINDPYNINTNQSAQQLQQQYLTNTIGNQQAQHLFAQAPTQFQQQQQYPTLGRPFSQQQHPLDFQQSSSRHYLQHQRSLPLPPPIIQQLQARQQQQQHQRHYYQSANKLHFDDQRYYTGSNPLLEQSVNYYNQAALNDSPFYQQATRPAYYHNQLQYRSRRPRYNLESTRGFNHSLQSQWLYGGAGRRSMAGDLLLSGQVSALGDTFDADQKIVNEFCVLYDESRQLFNGLR